MDPHQCKTDPDPHQCQNSGSVEAQNKAMEAVFRILIFSYPGSRIQQEQNRGGQKNIFSYFL